MSPWRTTRTRGSRNVSSISRRFASDDRTCACARSANVRLSSPGPRFPAFDQQRRAVKIRLVTVASSEVVAFTVHV